MRRWVIAGITIAILATAGYAAAQPAKEEGGVIVRRPSFVRNLVSAEKLEKAAAQQYGQLREQAVSRGSLLPPEDPQVKRVQRITQDLLPHVAKWNARAKAWNWEVIVVKTPAINALVLPGGKIAIFTGLLDVLKITDDELALVIGHELAHALREHARARAAKTTLTRVGTFVVQMVIGGGVGELARQGGGLLTLKFSRDDERDADLIGLELTARAGYNPEAGVVLWRKMSLVAKSNPLPWLSTHPSGEDRAALVTANLKYVMPLYEKARANRPAAAN
jgi:predicted Zn-dependent protease